jgi:hypothetical protein
MSAAEQVPGGSPDVDDVLDQALTWLWRSVGFDTARVLAYDPAVLIPVSIAASEPLPWEQVVAACRNKQAEADVHVAVAAPAAMKLPAIGRPAHDKRPGRDRAIRARGDSGAVAPLP